MPRLVSTATESQRRSPPATTPEGRQNQLVSLAMDLAEKRIRAGTASAQEVTHFLKVGSLNARVEREILELQKDLIAAKTEAIHSSKRTDALFDEAISAMKLYSGNGDSNDYDF